MLMVVELSLFLFFYFVSIYFSLFQKIVNNNKLIFIFIQFVIIYIYLLFIGTRPIEFVSDTERYIEWFNNVKSLSSFDAAMNIYTDHTGMARDSFFSAFLYFLSHFFDEPNHLIWLFPLIIAGMLVFIGVKHFQYKSDILLFSLLLFFNRMYLDYSLNQFRSSAVFLLVIIVLYYIYERKKYSILVITPVMFLLHRKAVVLSFGTYLISFLNFKLLFSLLCVSVIIYFFPELLFSFRDILFQYLLEYGLYMIKSDNLLETFNENIFSINFYIQFLLFIVVPLILLTYKIKEMACKKIQFLYFKIILISLIMFFSLFNFIPEVYRLFQLIIPLLFILLISNKNKLISSYLIVLLIINSITFSKNIVEMDISLYNFLVGLN